MADGHVLVLRDFSRWPAIYLFRCSCGALAGFHLHPKVVTRVVEMDELLQALDVAVVEELLLEVRAWGFRRGTLRRHKTHVARRHRLHLPIGCWCELDPGRVRVGT